MTEQNKLIGSFIPSQLTIVIHTPPTGQTMVLGGFMPDSIVDIERGDAAWTSSVSADGYVSRAHNIDETATANIHLDQTSASNDFLSRLYEYDKNDLRGRGLFHCAILDKSGRSYCYSNQAFVAVLANQSFGKIFQREIGQL